MNFVLSFIVNAISNAVIGVPVVITKISVGSWVGGFSGLGVSYAGHCSSDFSCDPFIIDGYHYNESDGKWYSNPPRPDIGEYTWNGEAPTEKQQWLTEIRNGVIQHFISRENPLQDIQSKFGQASTIPSPIVLDLDAKKGARPPWRYLKPFFPVIGECFRGPESEERSATGDFSVVV